MTDRVSVSNLALSELGESDRITDPDDDTKPAREIAAVWDEARKTVLRAGAWNFAMSRRSLAAEAGVDADEIWPFGYAFPLPEGSLRLIEVLDPPLGAGEYKIESGRILADTIGPLRVRCVFDRPDPATWDNLFVDAFAKFLAWKIADAITGDRGRKGDCWSAYRDALPDAKRVDAIEEPPIDAEEDDWISARDW